MYYEFISEYFDKLPNFETKSTCEIHRNGSAVDMVYLKVNLEASNSI